eukprot:PhM_4_TR3457/c0_g1_i2/m.73631
MELVWFPNNSANYNNDDNNRFDIFPSFALPQLMRQYGIGDDIKSHDVVLARDVPLLLTRECPNLKHVYIQGFHWSAACVPSLLTWACRAQIEEICLVGCRVGKLKRGYGRTSFFDPPVDSFSTASCEFPSLRRLSIRACGNVRTLAVSPKCIPSMPNLESLSITRSDADCCSYGTMFFKSVRWIAAPNIRELILVHSRTERPPYFAMERQEECIENLHRCFPHVERLWLGLWILNGTMRALASHVGPNLKSLALKFEHPISGTDMIMPHLEVLHVTNAVPALRCFPNLRVLSVCAVRWEHYTNVINQNKAIDLSRDPCHRNLRVLVTPSHVSERCLEAMGAVNECVERVVKRRLGKSSF